MTMTETVVVLDPISPQTAERMRALLPPGLQMTHSTARDEAHLQAMIADADYAISGQIAVGGAVLQAATRLKLLHKWGVGTDNFDLEAARRLGVKVARTTGSNAVPVAEFTIASMIGTLRGLADAAARLDRGEWNGANFARPSFLLSGKTVGLIGFGAIGQTVARLLGSFGCEVLYYQRRQADPAIEQALRARKVSVAELLTRSDVVSLHCPLTPETEGLIDRAALSSMKRTAVLINMARGGVVVEPDLIWALQERVIQGAAMDVFATEPLPPGSPLMGVDGMTITPHIAASSADTFDKTVQHMFTNIGHVSRGEPVPESDAVV
jgi:phosphoglycerate dehydrogenase-like enzyme